MISRILPVGWLLFGCLLVSCSDKPKAEKRSAEVGSQEVVEKVQAIEPFAIAAINSTQETSLEEGGSETETQLGTLGAVVGRDLAKISETLGGNPERIRRFVAESIAYESYDGILRGTDGTYLAAAGNSADRSLLLVALLRLHDENAPIRFASCNNPGLSAPTTITKKIATDPAQLEKQASQSADKRLAASLRWYAQALSRARFEAKQSETQLATVLEPVLKPILASRAWAAENEKVHFWPQLNQGGSWLDLDPSAPNGKAPCTATATMSDIPSEHFHRVVLSVVVETLKAGRLEETEALRVERTTAELASARILFAFGEPNGLVQPAEDRGDGLENYTPVFLIDGETFADKPLALPRLQSTDGPHDVGGGLADTLGGGFYGGVEPTSVPDEEVMSAWIQVSLSSPGGEKVNARSEVFDRLGMAIRLKGSDSDFNLIPLPVVEDEYAATASLWQIGLALGELRASWTTSDVDVDALSLDDLSSVLDEVARSFPTVRRDLGGDPAFPIVLMVGIVPTLDQSGGSTAQVVFDALHVGSAGADNAINASRNAVASPFAEYLLASIIGNPTDELGDVVHVMRAASASSIPLMTITSADARNVEGASPVAAARIYSRIRQGQVLFAPTRSPITSSGMARTAWWYFDPESGLLVDEHENGRHVASGEYLAVNKAKKPGMMATVRKYACMIAIPFMAAIGGLSAANPTPGLKSMAKATRSLGRDEERRRRRELARQALCRTQKSIKSTPPGPPP